MRISLARKNIFHEPIRLLISVGGVTFAIFLILVLLALYRGWSETLSQYIYNVDADIWVMQEGAIDMSHSISLMPNATRDQLLAVEGVTSAEGLVGNRVMLDLDTGELTSRVMGFNTATDVGGPADMIAGQRIPQSGEIIIDQIVRTNHGLDIGDTMTIKDTDFTIIGIAAGGPLFQQSYITQDDARSLFQLHDYTNFFVVSVTDGQNVNAIMQRIEDTVPGVDAQSEVEFATNNEKEIMDKFLPIILVLVFIGFIVGVVIISLTIYTATIEKIREYGVLKAIGASNGYLYRVVLIQSCIAGSIGFGLGTVLTFVGSDVIQKLEPLFVTLLKWEDVASVAGMTVVMIVLATYIPVRRIFHIDPAIVFKA